MKPSLVELGTKYSSDKLHWHSYFNDSMYPKLFQGMEVKRLLEIGIGERGLMQPFLPKGVEYCHGSSLRVWREYFPDAEIYGVDIREDLLFQEDRIHTMRCDQSKIEDLLAVWNWSGGDFDVVIDDGSHQFEHQQCTAGVLLPLMKPGSLYVVEDIWHDTGDVLARAFGGELWKGEKGRDDNMVVIKR